MTDYSETAAEQLDELQNAADDGLWDAVIDALELALNFPGKAQNLSSAVTTDAGAIVFHLPVAGHPPMKVFWSNHSTGPRIEAVFPYP